MTSISNGRIAAREDGPVERIDLATLINDGNGNGFTYAITRPPVEGVASVRGSVLRFNPADGFQDLARGETRVIGMEVTATDRGGASETSTITLRVRGTNDAPEISTTRLTTTEDGPVLRLDLDGIATDPDGDALSYEITGQPAGGVASIRGSTLRFNPGNDFQDLQEGETRNVRVEVTATDPDGATDTGFVTMRVIGTNDAPEITATRMTAAERGAVKRLDLDTIASDPEGGALSYVIVGEPEEGTASIRGSTLRFNPGADFADLQEGEWRNVQIDVLAMDADGGSTEEVITVRVQGRNSAPEITATRVSTTEDGPVVRLDLDTIATDPDGDALSYEITGQPDEGVASIRGSTLRFNPGADFQNLSEGERRNVQIEVTATDPTGARRTETVTVSVTGADDGPVLRPVILQAREDGPIVRLNLNQAIDDPDSSGPMSYVIAGDIAAGTAWIDGAVLKYDPGDEFQGLAEGESRFVSVPVTAFENGGSPTTYNVSVEVLGRNDAPTFQNKGFDTDPATGQGQADLAALTKDMDGSDRNGPFTYEIINQPSAGRAWIEGSKIRYDAMDETDFLAEGQVGRFQVDLRITDPSGGSTKGSVLFRVVGDNDAPVFVPEQSVFTVSADDPTDVDFRSAFNDPDGNTLNYFVNGAGHPEVETDSFGGGFLTFEPGRSYQDLEPGEIRSVFVEVSARDEEFSTGPQTIEFQVVGGPDPVGRPDGVGFEVTTGEGGAFLGRTARSLGDLDNDGVNDIALMYFSPDPSLTSGGTLGEAFVLFGRDQAEGESFPLRVNAYSDPAITDLEAGEQAFGDKRWAPTLAPLGDVNGDGIDDLLVGDREDSELMVLFGREEGGFGLQTDLTALDGSDGFVLRHGGERIPGYIFGEDLNGDGLNDIVIQTPGNYAIDTYTVVFGQSSGFDAVVDVAAQEPDDAAVFASQEFVIVGDVNGDGFDDMVVGHSDESIVNDEQDGAYLVFGDADGWWDATSGFTDWAEEDSVYLTGPGSMRASMGSADVNGDGLADLIVHNTEAAGGDSLFFGTFLSSEVYVVFGRADGFGESLDLAALDGSDGFAMDHTERTIYQDETTTFSASGAGDINDDGIEDILIRGAKVDEYYSGGNNEFSYDRVSYLVFGKETGFDAEIELDDLDGSDGYRIINEVDDERTTASGFAEGAGDVNGDGIDDLLISDSVVDVDGAINAGKAYVIFGGSSLSEFDANDGTEDGTIYLAALTGADDLL